MNLSPEMEAEIMEKVVAEIADRIWQKVESGVDEIICLPMYRMAGAMHLSESTARRLCTEFVDFGARDTRVTLAAAKRVIESRTVRPRKK